MAADQLVQLPPDTLLSDELVAEELVEMANLTTAQTGVLGTIFVSTVMGGHGPRVKYFVRPGQPSFSVLVADPPRVVANSLPEGVLRQRAPDGIRWVGSTRMRCSISGITATPGPTRKVARSSRR